MRTRTLTLFTLLLALTTRAAADDTRLVEKGTSRFVIYHPADAPPSVTRAAAELQQYVEKVSGAKLAIVDRPQAPMICLGDNPTSQAAGLSTKDMPWEAFRITTKEGNVFILGRDTSGDQRTPGGGTSAGTRNGVYTFIERYLGVRWLMPGEQGEYVPKSADVSVPAVDLSDGPFFLNRRLPYTQERRPEVKLWQARQRLGLSLYLSHGHNWRRAIPASHFEEHPDWFPERGGQRVPPTGRYKLCTTNPGLVRAFADAANAFFDNHPAASCYSLSPSDSAGYCECERCRALYETDPNGRQSVTPAILTFYNDVARLVRPKHPDKLLVGYVYAAYVFPPKTPIKLEPNVFLAWAPSFDYGYTLFRPELRRQWEDLLAQWTRVTRNISYYDLPVNVSTEAGALNPPGLKILKFIYPRLKAAGVKGVYVYGIEAWGRAGALNYILARLAWDPEADVEVLFDEYCAKAYGRGGDEVNRVFRLLDAEMERHFLEFSNARYHLSNDMMRDVYVKNLPEVERLYLAARSKVEDPHAKARLEMIGDNLTVLHWNLRQLGMLKEPERSSFYLSDADFFKFLSARSGSLALSPTAATRRPSYVKRKLSVSPAGKLPCAAPARPFQFRGDQHLVLRPTGGVPVEVRFSRVRTRGKLVTWHAYTADGKSAGGNLVSGKLPIKLDPTGSPYYHLAIAAGSASYMVTVTGADWAVDARLGDQGLHFLGKVAPLYFQVPKGQEAFHLSLEASPPGETAAAVLYSPDGSEAARFDCSKLSVDRQRIAVGPDRTGWWRLDVHKAATGAMDDVWVNQGDELGGYFSPAPDQALEVRP